MKIDAHQHFWKFNPVRDSWINEEMKGIQRDFDPADLQPVLQQNGFSGCVTVQSDQSEEENAFQLKNAAHWDFIKGVVGWVDLQAKNVEERLEYYSQFTHMKGFRHVLQGEPQRDYMLRPNFMRGVNLLNKFGYTYDVLIFPDQLQFTYDFVKAFPQQPFVIDHIAKPYIKDGKIDEWKKDMRHLGECPNVFCKISGMVTEASWNAWNKPDFTPYLDVIIESFGTDRIMFGSDWPVCLVAATYGDMLTIATDYFAAFTEEEKDKIFGENASIFYHLNQ